MLSNKNILLQQFFRLALSFLITVCTIRIYEYFTTASKLFVERSYRFELEGLLYDIWLWLIYCFVVFVPFLLLYTISKRLATIVLHSIHVLFIVCYLALIITFSERTIPFDHELFTRNIHDSIDTVKQMMTGNVSLYIPFIAYVLLYFILYYIIIKGLKLPRIALIVTAFLAIMAVSFIKYSIPSRSWFKQTSEWYLVCNKFSYWLNDSYQYFTQKTTTGSHKLESSEIEKEIIFYQKNQPFQFTGSEYPLLHYNNDKDVLGTFFNFRDTPPNIVILVVEGLSRDFSGENAYAGSFTPFLDSLSKKSLVWNNFLSTAPGTFAAHPAISGSLPYGKRGFSIMNVMPDHLSLIKILKDNGYFTSFMIGFNPDFDNMGGYIRLQGTDFILSTYGPEYKRMGVGKEGWSMGYPDDALFHRSFEALNSIHKSPYLSIYHTATSHMPYLFEQKPVYDKRFDKKIKTMAVSRDIKRTLKETKDVLATFMFADDCIKKFFSDYSKRADFSNTIFFITGDHHIGSFPSTGEIDDYHVPFIIYSTLLKHPQKFLSVNSHNNITPTILALLFKNFNLPHKPEKVHWLGGVIDTCTAFRNIHSMPFMEWSRDISDYIYKGYFLSHEQLYKLTPDLMQEEYENDSIKSIITRLRENFKIINSYVCDNNKIYPGRHIAPEGDKQLLKEYIAPSSKLIFSNLSDIALTDDFEVPKGYKYLYVEVSARVNMPDKNVNYHPSVCFALIDTKQNNRNYLYESKRDIVTLSKREFMPGQWNGISANDMFTLNDYKKVKDLKFSTSIYTDSIPINLRIQKLKISIYGIKSAG